MEVGAVDEIDAEDAERLLLLDIGVVEHPDMQDDVVGRHVGSRLQPHPHPAVAFVALAVALRGDRVGEGEKRRFGGAVILDSRQDQVELLLQHALQPRPRDIASVRRGTVYLVAEFHVVGRHRLGDGAGGGARLEKPARDLLARADLDQGAVFQRVEIDRQRLLDGVGQAFGHGGSSVRLRRRLYIRLRGTVSGGGRTPRAPGRAPR